MKLILENTDIFDNNLGEKLLNLFEINSSAFKSDKFYRITFTYNVYDNWTFLTNEFGENYDWNEISIKKGEKALRNTLKVQVKKIETVINDVEIKINHLKICGDEIPENQSCIIVEIEEEDKKANAKAIVISANEPGIRNKMEKMVNDRLFEIFCDFYKNAILFNKKFFALIMGLPETSDDDLIWHEFFHKYKTMTFLKEDELANDLVKRAEEVINNLKESGRCEI